MPLTSRKSIIAVLVFLPLFVLVAFGSKWLMDRVPTILFLLFLLLGLANQ
jgi:hypothetical protein